MAMWTSLNGFLHPKMARVRLLHEFLHTFLSDDDTATNNSSSRNDDDATAASASASVSGRQRRDDGGSGRRQSDTFKSKIKTSSRNIFPHIFQNLPFRLYLLVCVCVSLPLTIPSRECHIWFIIIISCLMCEVHN